MDTTWMGLKEKGSTVCRILIAETPLSRLAAFALAACLLCAPACFEPRTEVSFEAVDQDINESESEIADRAIKVLLAQSNIQMVFCRRAGQYEVHSRTGKVFFRRVMSEEETSYEVVTNEGTNPLALTDPKALADLASELAAGDNPNRTDYRSMDKGYTGPNDPRISFLGEENVTFPLAYERIAALFDGEHVGDLVLEFTPWGWYPLGTHEGKVSPGAHGQLNVVSSRAPLIFAGKGVHHGEVIDGWARSVDIAPTVARALGIAKTFGVNEHGRYGTDVYLKWQDGHVLQDLLSGQGPTHLLILVNDSLTHSELVYQLASKAKLPTYRWLLSSGTLYRYGQVVNFPSNTFASHNTIGSGAYSGHHGLVDNWFFDRKTQKRHDPLTQVFETGKLLTDEVETLHEAIHRSFGNWDPESDPLGSFTASINSPSTRGADLALLEGRQPIDWSKCPEPPGLSLPALDSTISLRAQAADNLAVSTFVKAYLGTRSLGGKTVRCAQMPRYTIINLSLIDDVSHENGPHSNGLRRAIVQTDQRQQILLDTLRRAGILDRTLIVFTSDHGQCLQDTSRVQDFEPALTKAGIRAKVVYSFIYLLTFDVALSTASFARGKSVELTVTVKDDDTDEPVAGATVTLASGSATKSAKTDANGQALLSFVPAADRTRVVVSDGIHTDYSKEH